MFLIPGERYCLKDVDILLLSFISISYVVTFLFIPLGCFPGEVLTLIFQINNLFFVYVLFFYAYIDLFILSIFFWAHYAQLFLPL